MENEQVTSIWKSKKFWIVAILALFVIVNIGVFISSKLNRQEQPPQNQPSAQDNLPPFIENVEDPLAIYNSDNPDFMFQRFPFDLEDVGSVAPIGEFAGIKRSTVADSHFYGNMRHYVFSKHPGKVDYNVYVPADGQITGFRYLELTGQYRFNFQIDGKSFYYLDHIQSLDPAIAEKLAPKFGNPIRYTNGVEQISPGIKVKAGDILGKTGLKGTAWDWGMIDQRACTDIIAPEHYRQDSCPKSVWTHLTPEMQAQVTKIAGYWTDPENGGFGLEKVTTAKPLGQYAHDIAGTLSGGWMFDYQKPYANAFFTPDAYYDGQLQIRLGIPELDLLGVWRKIPIGTDVNPDPKTVTVEDGIVVYTLTQSYARDTNENGMLLVRVNADNTVTIEALANMKSAPKSLKFSAKALTIKR